MLEREWAVWLEEMAKGNCRRNYQRRQTVNGEYSKVSGGEKSRSLRSWPWRVNLLTSSRRKSMIDLLGIVKIKLGISMQFNRVKSELISLHMQMFRKVNRERRKLSSIWLKRDAMPICWKTSSFPLQNTHEQYSNTITIYIYTINAVNTL